jgi:hypothetical protein
VRTRRTPVAGRRPRQASGVRRQAGSRPAASSR